MGNILTFASILAPIVIAVVQTVKKAFNPKTRYLPLIALGVGIILGALATPLIEADILVRLWAGAIAGLSSMGLYDLSKVLLQDNKKIKEE